MEKLGYQDFDAGSADLTDASRKKLDVMAKRSTNAPGLQLQISGSIDPVKDRDGLQRATLEKGTANLEWASLPKSQQATTVPNEIVLTPDERSHLVRQLYDKALKDGTITPALFQANTNLAVIASHIKAPPAAKCKTWRFYWFKNPSSSPRRLNLTRPCHCALKRWARSRRLIRWKALLTAIIPVSDSDFETLALGSAKPFAVIYCRAGRWRAASYFWNKTKAAACARTVVRFIWNSIEE